MTDRIPLILQIAEVKREIALRERVLPSYVAARKMTQAEADMHLVRMRAVQRTLEWFETNESVIRSAIADARAAEEHPAVAGVLAAFPGAEVKSVRKLDGAAQ